MKDFENHELLIALGVDNRHNIQEVVIYDPYDPFTLPRVEIHRLVECNGRIIELLETFNKANRVELTEEILLKYGFIKNEKETMLDYDTFSIDMNELLFEADGKFYHNLIQTEDNQIEYLHELENLYFALTKNQLKPTK
jgi:hypothetical protein